MIGTRHEEYNNFINGLPFVLNTDITRTRFNLSQENNWHENLEIQLCNEGSGNVLIDGQEYGFEKNDIVVVNSNAIHYTGTDEFLNYSCLIISTDFCRQIGIDTRYLTFESKIKSCFLNELLTTLMQIYRDSELPCRVARLNKTVIEILIELSENHTVGITPDCNEKYEPVKQAISYIRKNYNRKLTLDEISKSVFFDKYALCREFKKMTGRTIVEYLNKYRCLKAVEIISSGTGVAAAASLCGFGNLSFFTKTFKRYIGKLPSEYK